MWRQGVREIICGLELNWRTCTVCWGAWGMLEACGGGVVWWGGGAFGKLGCGRWRGRGWASIRGLRGTNMVDQTHGSPRTTPSARPYKSPLFPLSRRCLSRPPPATLTHPLASTPLGQHLPALSHPTLNSAWLLERLSTPTSISSKVSPPSFRVPSHNTFSLLFASHLSTNPCPPLYRLWSLYFMTWK